MWQMVDFFEEYFIQYILRKYEKHSKIFENFLDIWASWSLSNKIQDKNRNSQIHFKVSNIKSSGAISMLGCTSFKQTRGKMWLVTVLYMNSYLPSFEFSIFLIAFAPKALLWEDRLDLCDTKYEGPHTKYEGPHTQVWHGMGTDIKSVDCHYNILQK